MDRLGDLFAKLEGKSEPAGGPPEYIIAGLGNPGLEYEGTRHNSGFAALDLLAGKYDCAVKRIRFKSLCGDTIIAGRRVLLLKPQTYMNASGEAVRDAAAYYKVPMERVIVLFDDISLPVGKIRVRPKGSDGGHNGIKSIIYLTGTEVFPRVKIGVGAKPRPDYDLAAWVLGKISPVDLPAYRQALSLAVLAAGEIIQNGCGSAMNLYNGEPA